MRWWLLSLLINQEYDEQDDDEQNIIEAVDRMERDLGLIRLAISRRENAPRWKCAECGETVEGQKPPKICPGCDAGDPTSLIRAQWTKEAA